MGKDGNRLLSGRRFELTFLEKELSDREKLSRGLWVKVAWRIQPAGKETRAKQLASVQKEKVSKDQLAMSHDLRNIELSLKDPEWARCWSGLVLLAIANQREAHPGSNLTASEPRSDRKSPKLVVDLEVLPRSCSNEANDLPLLSASEASQGGYCRRVPD